MKTINIYITKKQKQEAYKIQQKYRVSFSTLVGCVSFWLMKYLNLQGNEEINKKLLNEYIQKENNYKTSVKPREIMEGLSGIEKKNVYASNAIIIYIEKSISKYIKDPEIIKKYYQKIDKQLTTTNDPYWDYNLNIRNTRRMMRQNKDYWRKVLEEQ